MNGRSRARSRVVPPPGRGGRVLAAGVGLCNDAQGASAESGGRREAQAKMFSSPSLNFVYPLDSTDDFLNWIVTSQLATSHPLFEF